MCEDCRMAEEQDWHAYRRGCFGCEARSIARSAQAFEALVNGEALAAQNVRDTINRVFAVELREAAKREVRRWWDHDHKQQETT